MAGWATTYTWKCDLVDTSTTPQAYRVSQSTVFHLPQSKEALRPTTKMILTIKSVYGRLVLAEIRENELCFAFQ